MLKISLMRKTSICHMNLFNIQTPYTTYIGLIDAFPKRWKKILREPVNACDSAVTIPKWIENTSRLTNKILYTEIIKTNSPLQRRRECCLRQVF